MTEPDPMLRALAALRAAAPSAELSRRLRAAGHARLVPAKVHPAWSVAIAASVLAYLSWALIFTRHL
jgi:hypothetical protein